MTVFQGLLDGLVGAVALAPVAAAFGLVYGSTGVFHIAVGAVYAIAPYVAFAAMRLGLPIYAAIGAALIAGSLVSIALEYFNHRPLERKRTTELGHFIASLGASTLLVQLIVMMWGADPVALRDVARGSIALGPLHLSVGQIGTAVTAVIALAAFYAWIPMSRRGLQLRALSSNPTEAALRGLNIGALRLLAFAISGLLCSAAAVSIAWDVGFDPYSGMTPTLLAIVAVALGGRKSFWGPVIGILIVGLVRGVAVVALAAQWQDVATFSVLAVALVARPSGILGTTLREGARQ